MNRTGWIIGAALAASAFTMAPAQAGGIGISVGVSAGIGVHAYGAPYRGGNHPYAWQYPSTYPYSIPTAYHAGPGHYYSAKRYRRHHARNNYRWTGYPPRHYYVVDYRGYAPQYGFHPYNDHYGYYR